MVKDQTSTLNSIEISKTVNELDMLINGDIYYPHIKTTTTATRGLNNEHLRAC